MEKYLKRQYQFLAVDTLQTTWLFGLFCGLLLGYDETLPSEKTTLEIVLENLATCVPSEKATGYEELDLNLGLFMAAIIFSSLALEILGTVKKNNIAMMATLVLTTIVFFYFVYFARIFYGVCQNHPTEVPREDFLISSFLAVWTFARIIFQIKVIKSICNADGHHIPFFVVNAKGYESI